MAVNPTTTWEPQQLFFPEGIPFSGKSFDRTAVTACAFTYFRPIEEQEKGLVDQICASSNPLLRWLRQLDTMRAAQADESATSSRRSIHMN